jgi:hypothetical protein
LHLKQRCSIGMAPLIELQIETWKMQAAYLYCDLLDRATLITITFKVKLPHIDMHEQYLKKNMFVKVKNTNIESKSKRGFEKDDMHVVIIVESTTIVSSIVVFEPKLVLMFFHMIPFENFNFFFKVKALLLLLS